MWNFLFLIFLFGKSINWERLKKKDSVFLDFNWE